ncbi:MAG: hypothetical protein ABI760_10435 [Ferruginibacter sp.]
MKTYIPKSGIKNLASLTLNKVKAGFSIFWKQSIYTMALALFTFSLSAQVSVTASLGTAGPTPYGTLKLSFDAINGGTHKGVIIISITGNTTETSSAVLNASGSGASNYSTISIKPSGGVARTISGSLGSPLVDLNGADNIIIDGLNTGGNSLIISNTSTTNNSSTIRFFQDASSNKIQNCTILGSCTGSNFGTIFFSTGTSAGNSNDTIANNKISQAGLNLPLNAIYSAGTGAAPNANITISNNNIFNYTTKGIEVGSASTSWVISGNSFYKEAIVFDTFNAIAAVYGIRVLAGSGYTISNNYIGGEGSLSSGNNATYNTTASLGFTGIQLKTSGATPASNIQGNTISKIDITAVSTSGSYFFYGIETSGSGITVGGPNSGEGNLIGSNAVNGAISLSTSNSVTTGASTIYGISFLSTGGLLLGNQVAGIDINNAGNTPVSLDFRGIYVSIAAPPSQVNNNIIGSVSASNSIRIMATSTSTGSNFTGIDLGSTITSTLPEVNDNIIQNISNLSTVSSGTFTGINGRNGYIQSYQNNIIRNIYAAANSNANSKVYSGIISSTIQLPLSTIIANNIIDNINYQSTGSAAQIRGMEISGSGSKVTTITRNSISNLTSFSQKTGISDTDNPSSFTIVGLLFSTTGNPSIISNNNFYNFSSLTTANTNTVVAGIGIISPGGGNIYGNRISDFTNSATGTTNLPGIIGIKAFSGTFNVYNNSIKISNSTLSNSLNIYGILQNTAATTWNYFHNSIAISGNVTSLNVARSAAFIRSTEGGLVLKNNILVNTRTGTGTHYAISNAVATPAATWFPTSSNYNNLYSSNVNTVAEWGTGVSNTFAQMRSNSGGEINSVNSSVSFITSAYDLQPNATSNCALNNAGTPITTPIVINTDLNANARSATNPDLGAYEFTYTVPVSTATNVGPNCIGQNINLGVTTGAGVSPFTYSWTGPNSFVAATQNPILSNLTALMSGIYTVTVTDPNGCAGNAQTIVSINALPAGTISSNVGNTTTVGSPVVFTATDGISYNFKINGNSMQNTAATTYTTNSLHTGDIVTVTVTNSNSCIADYTGITMTVSGIMVNGKNYIKWNGKKIVKWNGINKKY